MQTLLAIAAGGALGAVSRYITTSFILFALGGGFPWGTLTVNVLGSFVMGALGEVLAVNMDVAQELKFFLTVGFLGSFTTFSTFSLDVIVLMEQGEWVLAGSYILSSFVLSVLALFVGLSLMRMVVG